MHRTLVETPFALEVIMAQFFRFSRRGPDMVPCEIGKWVRFSDVAPILAEAHFASTNKPSGKIAALALYCVRCGVKFEFGEDFCGRCGTKRQLRTW